MLLSCNLNGQFYIGDYLLPELHCYLILCVPPGQYLLLRLGFDFFIKAEKAKGGEGRLLLFICDSGLNNIILKLIKLWTPGVITKSQ